MMNLKI